LESPFLERANLGEATGNFNALKSQEIFAENAG